MKQINNSIKKALEEIYDISFDVEKNGNASNSGYLISPKNEDQDLFTIKLTFRPVRLIIEIAPQKYGRNMLQDMQTASDDQKKRFRQYAEIVRKLGGKIDLKINNELRDINSSDYWNIMWNSFNIRISVFPLEENYIEAELATKWAEISAGLVLTLLHIEETDVPSDKYLEGRVSSVLLTKHERNPVNRILCIAANGYKCKICGFDFEKVYGEIGHDFIHVHHIIPVSAHDGEYQINPVTDLIPVCPNCHAMLHRQDPPLEPAELVKIINQHQEEKS